MIPPTTVLATGRNNHKMDEFDDRLTAEAYTKSLQPKPIQRVVKEFEARYREQLFKIIFLSGKIDPIHLPQGGRICTR